MVLRISKNRLTAKWSKHMVKMQEVFVTQKNKKKDAHLIISDITERPYIDELRCAYAFSSGDAAEDFAEKIGRAHVCTVKGGIGVAEMSKCYAAGANTLIERGGGKESRQTLQEDGMIRRHYNNELCADEARYIQTRQLDYIRSMRNCRFIVPVKIRNHPEMSVIYATANIPGMPYKYLAFSDLEEYGKWSMKNSGWDPLEVKAEGLARIGRRHGFLLDACGAKLLISRGMLQNMFVITDSKGENNV